MERILCNNLYDKEQKYFVIHFFMHMLLWTKRAAVVTQEQGGEYEYIINDRFEKDLWKGRK